MTLARPLSRLPGVLAAICVSAGCGRSSSRVEQRDARGDVFPTGPDAADTPFHTANGALGPRADIVVGAITSGDADFLRQRPSLVAGKYALMAADAFTFFRGSLALFLHDWNDPAQTLQATRFAANDARPFGLGDAHPENFGTMRTNTGIFRLEPNDFDTADRLPYLWDLRRLAVGMCLAARVSNSTDAVARAEASGMDRSIARAMVTSYADTLRALAVGGPRPAIEDGGGNPVLDDLFSRSFADWDQRTELEELTVKDGVRRLIRGTPDSTDSVRTTRDLPARARLGVAGSIADYLGTLPAGPSVTESVPLDAVQLFGQGVGSFPRVRALVLTRGPSTADEDDVILELKELPLQGSLPLPGPASFASPRERLLAALAAGWTERGADPFWGVGTWSGLPVQIRTEAAGFKTLRVSRLEGPLGTSAAIEGVGVALGRLVARMHAAPDGDGASLAGTIATAIAADPEGFADEQADVALTSCDQVMSDWELFRQALTLLGPKLGVQEDPLRAPSPDLAVLYDPQAEPRAAGIDPVAGPVTINEISATGTEYVEILSSSAAPLSVAGFGVADEDTDGGPRFGIAARFARGAVLPVGGRITVIGGFSSPSEGPQSTCVVGVSSCYEAAWDISASRGETMFLVTPENVIADQAAYPRMVIAADQSWSRLPDGTGPFSTGTVSPNEANVGP